MQVVYVGLLLLSVTWAAPTLQPQTVKTSQGYVEEQKQEEKSKDNIALHHFDKGRNQEQTPQENIIQEREDDLFLFEVNDNNRRSEFSNLSSTRPTPNDDYGIRYEGNAYDDLMMSMYSHSTGKTGTEDGDDTVSKLRDQEEYGAALRRNNRQQVMRPVTVAELWREEHKKKPKNVLGKMPAGVHYAKTHSKDKKNDQGAPPAQNSPVKSKSTRHIRRNAYHLKRLPKIQKVPSDFEGSGYTDLQERGDNDISPFSGDGQPFNDIHGKGGAMDPDLDSTDIQTGLSGPGEAETRNPVMGGPGYNEIPEREGHGRNAIGAKEAGVDVSLVDSSNDIIGSTSFRELPGKEGNRVDASSQNAHQGKVELHYLNVPSKEKVTVGGRDASESASYNEIPKSGKASSRKSTEQSNRNQVTLSEKQRFSSQGKSQGLLIPSHGLDNEMGSYNGPNNERNIITHSRKNHYGPHGQNNSTRSKGMSQRRGSWGYRKSHSNRSFNSSKRDDSSESSESGSSSESDGD
ncbi:matrix extracellular phosphoglycoprotein isoform X2 [Castor canadensis]|uniref:Matrix extracellular phosphoglycoprotein isoform X2 n=1 Tax=Castor canadensis TaxID=51338 RepID=A0AC58JWY6_CASCN